MSKAEDVLALGQEHEDEELPETDEEMDEDSEVESQSEEEQEKSETEEELERLVFGDTAGFKQSLKQSVQDDVNTVAPTNGATGFEGLSDADLFMTDVDPTSDGDQLLSIVEDDNNSGFPSHHPAAWEDSDDERILVSLASVPRLRKLRRTEAEDVVNGKEYSKRLRQQYQLLMPTPDWARQAMQNPIRKRRRLSNDGESDDGMSNGEMDFDEDLPSTAPLMKLLQNGESLVSKAGPVSGKKRKLRPEVIDIQRTKDIAGVQPSAITSLSFHPQYPLLLSSGPASTLYLHHITPSPPAPTPNPLLTSVYLRGTPLSTTAFHPTDGRIFLSARRRYFHVWNLNTGRVEKISRVYGHQYEQRSMERFKLSPDGQYMALLGSGKKGGGVLNLLSTSSLQWICQVRIESRGGIADFAWWRNSGGLGIAGKNGEVTEWSILEQRVVARWQDEGAVGTTTLAFGGHHEFVKSLIGTDRWIAIGSSSGIVNIYDRRAWLASPSPNSDQPIPLQPTPTKVFDHLTTPTSHLAFSPDGQLLAMASRWKADALRLIHLPSCTVFKNWPTSTTPLGRISSLAFASGESIGGDLHSLLAVANEQGKVRMWEIR